MLLENKNNACFQVKWKFQTKLFLYEERKKIFSYSIIKR